MNHCAPCCGASSTYRRYANTDDLIRHLTLTVAPSLDFSVLEPSRESLRTVLRRIIDCFDEEFELKAIGVVLSSENAHLRNIAKSVIEPAAERFYDFLRRGMASGAFRAGLDAPFRPLAQHREECDRAGGRTVLRFSAPGHGERRVPRWARRAVPVPDRARFDARVQGARHLVRGPARRLGGQHDGVVVGVHPACAIIHRRLSGFSTVLSRQRWLY